MSRFPAMEATGGARQEGSMAQLVKLLRFFRSDDTGAVTIDWVAVGDAGNAADPATGFGAVQTPYRISEFEITNAQYAEFLNAVAASDPNDLYNTSMGAGAPAPILRDPFNGREPFSYIVGAGLENLPVNFVSFLDAARFANWLHNGQPTGAQDDTTTEDGAYTLTPGTSAGSMSDQCRQPVASFQLFGFATNSAPLLGCHPPSTQPSNAPPDEPTSSRTGGA